MNKTFAVLALSLGTALMSSAAPRLRITTAAFGPFPIAQGSNGPTQSANAYNVGDGSLSPKASSSDTWLVPTVGASTMFCGISPSPCFPISIALQTSSLAPGAYTGFVTVSDPNAVDSPQTISVTVNIGGNVPSQLTLYAPPGGTASASYTTASGAGSIATTQSGGNWLSVTGAGVGSLAFTIPFTVTANANSLSAGDYNGTVTVANSSLPADNKAIGVTLHVTTSPIAQLTAGLPSTFSFQIPQGGIKQNYFTAYPFYPVLTNAGQGTLSITGETAATTSGGNWLSVSADSNGFLQITADATGLAVGNYQGTITVTSNAVNSPTVIPVKLAVVAPGPPSANYPVANGFTQSASEGIAQGDFIALFGSQFTTGDPKAAPSLPLGTDLGNGTQVLLNGKAVPIQFVSYSQINIQIPYDTPIGSNNTLQVVRNGTAGNTLSINVAARAPAVLPWSGGPYVLAQTGAGGFEGYSPSVPAHRGDFLRLYAVGLGPTTPAVAAGTSSPCPNSACSVQGPLATVTPTPKICFSQPNGIGQASNCVAADFAGLTPTLFALYQLDFHVPATAPLGDMVPIFVQMTDVNSNLLYIAIH